MLIKNIKTSIKKNTKHKTYLQTDNVNSMLDANWCRKSLQKESAVYIEQQLRKSWFFYRQTDGRTIQIMYCNISIHENNINNTKLHNFMHSLVYSKPGYAVAKAENINLDNTISIQYFMVSS